MMGVFIWRGWVRAGGSFVGLQERLGCLCGRLIGLKRLIPVAKFGPTFRAAAWPCNPRRVAQILCRFHAIGNDHRLIGLTSLPIVCQSRVKTALAEFTVLIGHVRRASMPRRSIGGVVVIRDRPSLQISRVKNGPASRT